MSVQTDRLAALDTLHLYTGGHGTAEGHCAMERRRGGRPTTAESFWARVDRTGDCWLWTARTNEDGYGQVGYQRRSSVGAHRVAWALTHGGALPDAWVLHHCDSPPCCRPEHLFLGDVTDNNRDRQQKGRTRGGVGKSGPEHYRFTVTKEMEVEMRALRADGMTHRAIAERLGISRSYAAVRTFGVLPPHVRGWSA